MLSSIGEDVTKSAAYLATRNSGGLESNYHNYGVNFSEKLVSVLNNPNAIIRPKNGRLNIFEIVLTSKWNDSIVSVELNTVKDIKSENKAYNLVVTMFSAGQNYSNNTVIKNAAKIEYEKEDLSQVNPQLHKSLSTINEKSSDFNVPQNKTSVKYSSSEKAENDIEKSDAEYLELAKEPEKNKAGLPEVKE